MASKTVRVLIVPGGVILSTMFGGGYASGREVATFVSSYGPWGGVLATVVMALVFGLILVLCIEIARVFGTYEYASFSRVLLARAAIVYEAALVVGLFLALAVAATAAGSTLESRFSVPRGLGSALLMLGAIVLTFFGRRVVEWSMTISAGLLLAVLAGLVVVAHGAPGGAVATTFAREGTDPAFWQGGARYAVLGAAFFPLIIFVARDIETRAQSVASGLFIGAIIAVPALAMHVAFMAAYPSILDEAIPSYAIAEAFGSVAFLNVFVVVLFVLIVQTAVGIMQGLIERIDHWAAPRFGRSLRPVEHAAASAVVLIATVALSSLGMVTLVATGYGLLSLVFLATFTVPLFTVGVWRLRTSS